MCAHLTTCIPKVATDNAGAITQRCVFSARKRLGAEEKGYIKARFSSNLFLGLTAQRVGGGQEYGAEKEVCTAPFLGKVGFEPT